MVIITDNAEFYRLFFDLLDKESDEGTSDHAVWALLQELPSNPSFVELITNLDDATGWKDLLSPSQSVFRLLYSVQLMGAVMHKTPGWRERFVRCEGGTLVEEAFTATCDRITSRRGTRPVWQCLKSLIAFCFDLFSEASSNFTHTPPALQAIIDDTGLFDESAHGGAVDWESNDGMKKYFSDSIISLFDGGNRGGAPRLDAERPKEGKAVPPKLAAKCVTLLASIADARNVEEIPSPKLIQRLLQLWMRSAQRDLCFDDPFLPETLLAVVNIFSRGLLSPHEHVRALLGKSLAVLVNAFSISQGGMDLDGIVQGARRNSILHFRILKSLLKALPHHRKTPTAAASANSYAQYFCITEGLLRGAVAMNLSMSRFNSNRGLLAEILDLEKVLPGMLPRVSDIPRIESITGKRADPLLAGTLRLANTLLHLLPSDILNKSLSPAIIEQYCSDDFLFGDESTSLCCRPGTRAAGYTLLSSLCSKFPSTLLESTIAHIHDSLLSPLDDMEQLLRTFPSLTHGWGVMGDVNVRAATGYAGIVNLGCICYMNSLLQQLFMMPALRRNLLLVDTAGDEENEKEEILRHLQRVLVELSMTEKKAIDPSPWCSVFKNADGTPVNVLQQQDAQEFFIRVCSDMDETIVPPSKNGEKKSEKKGPFQTCMGIAVSNQLVCLDDPQFKKENDPVTEYCLSQDVQGCSDLYDSLDKYVAGEVLTDYKWSEKGGESCRTLKRQCISRLSDVFVVHLKRFVLDWETFTTRKVNSRFEFPMDLDLFPYTSEGLKWQEETDSDEARRADFQNANGDAYYSYRLVGVVVHTGASLNSGHYYSYIRERGGEDSEGKWYEFNDANVRNFDPASMPEAAFGGARSVRSPSSTGEAPDGSSPPMRGIPVVHNAYMLVYERLSTTRTSEESSCDVVKHVESVRESIKCDNAQLTCARRMLHEGFSLFVLKLFKQLQANTNIIDADLADSFLLATAKYAVYVLPRALDSKRAPALLDSVRKQP